MSLPVSRGFGPRKRLRWLSSESSSHALAIRSLSPGLTCLTYSCVPSRAVMNMQVKLRLEACVLGHSEMRGAQVPAQQMRVLDRPPVDHRRDPDPLVPDHEHDPAR